MPRLFNIDKFEFVHGPFVLPENIYIFRAEDPARPVPPTYPKFFGDYEVASFYADKNKNRCLKAYTLRDRVRVLDMRYVQAILPFLWGPVTSASDKEIIKMTSLVLGLTSLNTQIEMLHEVHNKSSNKIATAPYIARMEAFRNLRTKPSWMNPIESQGVRCGITDIDYIVMGFLKSLFGDLIDGIIAPALYSPFHDTISYDVSKSMMYQEIIIFDPSRSLIEVSTTSNQLSVEVPPIVLHEYIRNKLRVLTPVKSTSKMSMIAGSAHRGGMAATNVEPPDVFGELIGLGDTEANKKYKAFVEKSTKLAHKMIASQIFMQYYCPNTCDMGEPSIAKYSRNQYVRIGFI